MAASTARPGRDDPRPAGVRRVARRCCACAAAASRTAWTNLETLGAGIDDSLYGFRVYPIAPLVEIMRGQTWMRRFDFDTEAVVRLAWRGITPINIAAPVKYLRADEGGVSHFRYGRDNALLTWMHLRLLLGFALRLPLLAARRLARRPPFGVT